MHGPTDWDNRLRLTPPDPDYEQELWDLRDEADAIRADDTLTERYERGGR